MTWYPGLPRNAALLGVSRRYAYNGMMGNHWEVTQMYHYILGVRIQEPGDVQPGKPSQDPGFLTIRVRGYPVV